MNDMISEPALTKKQRGRPRKLLGTPVAKRKRAPGKTPFAKSASTVSAAMVAQNRALVHARLYGPILPSGEVVSSLVERIGAAEKRIPDEIRRLIVELNACRQSPSQVVRYITELTGFELKPQEVEYYNPTRRAGAGLKHEWRVLFDDTRRLYDARIRNLNMSQLAWRLEELQEIYDTEKLKPKPNPILLLKILEQGARDASGAFGRAGAEPEKPTAPLTDREKVNSILHTMAEVVRRQQAETGTSEMLDCLPPASQAVIHEVNGTTPNCAPLVVTDTTKEAN